MDAEEEKFKTKNYKGTQKIKSSVSFSILINVNIIILIILVETKVQYIVPKVLAKFRNIKVLFNNRFIYNQIKEQNFKSLRGN